MDLQNQAVHVNAGGGTELHAPVSRPAAQSDILAASVTSIEHPCIIKDVDKGLKSLGGRAMLERILDKGDPRFNSNPISLSLRPDDLSAKPLPSRAIGTNNVLLKITVPKRTGRKRKRGSSGPFVKDGGFIRSDYADPKVLARSLQDNPNRYWFQALGTINETHRFRSLPDAQYAATASRFAAAFRKDFMPLEYASIKDFRVDPRNGIFNEHCDAGPPAEFIRVDIPFNYSYLQNPLTFYYKEEGAEEFQAISSNRFQKPDVQRADWNSPIVPSKHKEKVPESKLPPNIRVVIKQLRDYFDQRPINTTRVLKINISCSGQNKYHVALPYVAYSYTTGPWKNCMIKLGLDPRLDPQYRIYQQISFQVRDTGQNRDEEEYRCDEFKKQQKHKLYTFDGQRYTIEASVWQVCDITDPTLAKVFATQDLRPDCKHRLSGWYHVGTLTKAKVIMRDKMVHIREGKVINEKKYTNLVNFPEEMTMDNMEKARISTKNLEEGESSLLVAFRSIVSTSLKRGWTDETGDTATDAMEVDRENSNKSSVEDGGEDVGVDIHQYDDVDDDAIDEDAGSEDDDYDDNDDIGDEIGDEELEADDMDEDEEDGYEDEDDEALAGNDDDMEGVSFGNAPG